MRLILTILTAVSISKIALAGPPTVDAALLSKLPPDRAVAHLRAEKRWPVVEYDRRSEMVSFKIDDTTRGWIVYDRARPLSLHINLAQILPATAESLLQLVGQAHAPPPSGRFREGESVHLEWKAGFGHFKKVTASTRLAGVTIPRGFVGSRVDLNFVSEAVIKRWEDKP